MSLIDGTCKAVKAKNLVTDEEGDEAKNLITDEEEIKDSPASLGSLQQNLASRSWWCSRSECCALNSFSSSSRIQTDFAVSYGASPIQVLVRP